MKLSELDMAYIYIGLRVKSAITGAEGKVYKISYDDHKCMIHDRYHVPMIHVTWRNNHLSVQPHCNMESLIVVGS